MSGNIELSSNSYLSIKNTKTVNKIKMKERNMPLTQRKQKSRNLNMLEKEWGEVQELA